MLIRLDDEAFVDDLCTHFIRSGFTAERAGGSMVLVHRLDAPSLDQGRREVEFHLRVWWATNPEAGAEIAD
jgi:hypothetical protein